MKQNSIAYIEFTGRDLVTGKIFDTTSEEVAKENNIYDQNKKYGPLPIIVGIGEIIKGIDEMLLQMEENESKKSIISADKGFGQRRKELIVLVPLAEFTKRKIQPFPGLIVEVNGAYGRVQTVSGGRVRVDLNSDLAGHDLEYEVKVVKEVKDKNEKAQIIVEKFFPLKEKPIAKIVNEKLLIEMDKSKAQKLSQVIPIFVKKVKEMMPEIKEVEFVEKEQKQEKTS
ncbi:MAG: FKBP-type peptidyl-prolyl cis-trans isomerase [Candidatus Diapherotrites archaeon]